MANIQHLKKKPVTDLSEQERQVETRRVLGDVTARYGDFLISQLGPHDDGMADIYAETGDETVRQLVDRARQLAA